MSTILALKVGDISIENMPSLALLMSRDNDNVVALLLVVIDLVKMQHFLLEIITVRQ